MTYTYAYKTPDGVRHEATLAAASREDVFATLRRQGVKPIKVVAADGTKANGEIRGVRRRVVFFVALAAALVAGAVFFLLGESRTSDPPRLQPPNPPAIPLATPRHQIYGDPAIVGAFEAGDFGAVLVRPGDRYLAWYAQPGRLMCPKGTPARALFDISVGSCVPRDRDSPPSPEGSRACATDLESALSSDLAISDSDPREVRELKQIVNGMRAEFRAYLANGNGTPASYWRRLHERYDRERQIFERVSSELENERDPAVWERKNDALRRLGLRTIPNPREGE